MNKYYYIYILASQKNGTLYIGITNDLLRRVWEHRNKNFKGLTKEYNIDKLVYYEVFEDVIEAIRREKQLKKWNRAWKLGLIEKENYSWVDLYEEMSK